MSPSLTSSFFLAEMSAADWGGWTAMVLIVVKMMTDQFNRYQDRLDRESKAKEILDTLAAQEKSIRAEVAERERRLNTKIDDGIHKSAEALKSANNMNLKLERQSADMQSAIDAIEKPKG